MLESEAIEEYLRPLTGDQAHAIRSIRALIFELNPRLVETVDEGKWFGGLLTYNTTDGMFVYALGPRTGGCTTFHMMAYYCSASLQERHAAALKRVLSGKSCIKFKRYADVPEDALRDIISSAPAMKELLESYRRQHGTSRT